MDHRVNKKESGFAQDKVERKEMPGTFMAFLNKALFPLEFLYDHITDTVQSHTAPMLHRAPACPTSFKAEHSSIKHAFL
jgi:hypothetical protein